MNSGFAIQTQDRKSSSQHPSRPKKRKKLNECSILEEANKVLLLEHIPWLGVVVFALNILSFGLLSLTYAWNNKECKWAYRSATHSEATHIAVTSKDQEESLHELRGGKGKDGRGLSFEYRHVVYCYSAKKRDFISVHTNWVVSNSEVHAMREGLTDKRVAQAREVFGRDG